MNQHQKIQLQFYEYIKGEFTPQERTTVEIHLSSCSTCKQELLELINFVYSGELVRNSMPSDDRTTEYWNNFALRVENRIRNAEAQRINQRFYVLKWLESLISMHKRQVIAIGSSLAVICIAISVWLIRSTPSVENVQVQPTLASNQSSEVDKKVNRYLHKSKTLLVGISNLDLEKNSAPDIEAERKVSRELVREARFLRGQPLDYQSEKLINDLEKIQIEIGTMQNNSIAPRIKMVKNGIHNENLLFKLRMAASLYETRNLSNSEIVSTGDKK